MPYRRQIIAPFTAGRNTDKPPWMIDDRETEAAEDLIALFGTAKQRRGWTFDGTTADVSSDLQAVYRIKCIIANVTKTITTAANGNIYIHNPAGAGTLLLDAATGVWLPRAVYRDELLLCNQDGVSSMRRWAGADSTPSISDDVGTTVLNQATFSAFVFGSAPDLCTFFNFGTEWPISFKAIGSTTTSITADSFACPFTGSTDQIELHLTGEASNCVSIYNAGTVTLTGNNLDGVGTKWASDVIVQIGDSVLLYENDTTPGSPQFLEVSDASITDTQINVFTNPQFNVAAASNYNILRSCPFTDVAVHRDSLWGTGVAQYPNRVYLSPQGWYLGDSPGIPGAGAFANNALPVIDRDAIVADYMLSTIDVPSPYDGDINVALLSSNNPLLVLKRHNLYGIYGDFPVTTTQLIREDAGCIDIRSAQQLPMGPVWCGENGIWTYQNGRVIDLTQGRINREYRTAVESFSLADGDTIATGQVKDHLHVSLRIAGGTKQTWVFDIKNGVWPSQFTNHHANWYFSNDIPDEAEEMFWVSGSDNQGRVKKSSTVYGNTNGLNERDGDGTKPSLLARTGYNLSGKSPELETTMLDASVTARVFDGGAAGSTDVGVVANSHDSLRDTDTGGAGLSLGTILSASSSELTSFNVPRRSYFRSVNLRGRTHNLTFDVGAFDTDDHANGASVEIDSITMSFMDTAERT